MFADAAREGHAEVKIDSKFRCCLTADAAREGHAEAKVYGPGRKPQAAEMQPARVTLRQRQQGRGGGIRPPRMQPARATLRQSPLGRTPSCLRTNATRESHAEA